MQRNQATTAEPLVGLKYLLNCSCVSDSYESKFCPIPCLFPLITPLLCKTTSKLERLCHSDCPQHWTMTHLLIQITTDFVQHDFIMAVMPKETDSFCQWSIAPNLIQWCLTADIQVWCFCSNFSINCTSTFIELLLFLHLSRSIIFQKKRVLEFVCAVL